MQTDARSQVEGTVWQVLRAIYTRVLTDDKGAALDESQQSALLDRWHKAMEHDLAVLMLCVDQSASGSIEAMGAALQSLELLDEDAIQLALEALR